MKNLFWLGLEEKTRNSVKKLLLKFQGLKTRPTRYDDSWWICDEIRDDSWRIRDYSRDLRDDFVTIIRDVKHHESRVLSRDHHDYLTIFIRFRGFLVI